MFWANFLHIYQPPTQTEEIVRKVTDEGYRTLVRVLSAHPGARITLNVSAVLTKQLNQYGLNDVIDGFRRLAEEGRVELTGSAMYHPILPLIPASETIRQIELNNAENRRHFGDVYRPRGFFMPEMCYSLEAARIIRDMGFQWILVDEIAFNGRVGQARTDRLYEMAEITGLLVFFKERPFSAGITYGAYPSRRPFMAALGTSLQTDSYLLTGTDGEVYGHHRPGQERLLDEVFGAGEPPTCTVSELLDYFPKRDAARPLPSSWSTWEDEMAAGIPYPQWDYPGHELHRQQWQLTRMAIEAVSSAPTGTPGFGEARVLLDEGVHSCQYWWASCRPWWDTGMVEWGARKLHGAVDALRRSLPSGTGEAADTLLAGIAATARRWQDTGEAKRRSEQYMREHAEVTSQLTFGENAK